MGQALTADCVTVAWLTVDRDDNNLVWLLSHLVEAIGRCGPGLARELGKKLEEHGDESERYVLTSLIERIDESGQRRSPSSSTTGTGSTDRHPQGARYLLDNCCRRLQVVVTSRSQTGLPLEPDADARRTRRNRRDGAAFRHRPRRRPSSSTSAASTSIAATSATLTKSTDGWVAALQLASLSLRGPTIRPRLIEQLSGRHHAIGEFLAENVLDAWSRTMLEFLLATSVCERLCGDRCAAA